MDEGPITLTIHGVQMVSTLGIFGILLKQHKIWVRLKDRVNSLWHKHCKEIGEPYSPLDNGH